MSWLFVVAFGFIAGIITGIMGSIPAIAQTSFHDIAVSYEWWVIFAFIIAANCNKNWECALKTFVFFLISQPICYLAEVVAGSLTLDMAIYYYSAIWGPATLFTLPGGFVAFYINKQNVLGAMILGLGNTIQTLMGVHYFTELISNPPYHLLTTILCFASAIIMTIVIQKESKTRALTFVIMAVATVAIVALALFSGRVI